MSEDRIIVGAISGAFGIQGEVRIKSFCADPAAIGDYTPLTSEDGTREFQLKLSRPINNGFAGRIKGVDTKEQADALKGITLFTRRDVLPSLPDDEFYHTDLIGLDVFDTGGTKLGRVHTVVNHGAGDLLEVLGPNVKVAVLLPFTKAAVPTVDLASGRIITDPPDGLFE